ncbi:MAG: Plug domain-containing protein, partial [Myxococcales bacterium]|nr:Plug domain-containing protein [Myxococcales bacterium]
MRAGSAPGFARAGRCLVALAVLGGGVLVTQRSAADDAASAPPVRPESPATTSVAPDVTHPSPTASVASPPLPSAHEVLVLGPARELGGTTVHRDDTRDVPGTFGDPTRIVEVLPGVVPATSGLQAFYVRGAPPTSTGYFIDGVPVPTLYHVGFGPSVVHPALLDRADLFQGAAPARFGRYLGATIAGTTTTTGPGTRPRAEANLRVFDAGVLGEAPLLGDRLDTTVAARYGYPGLVVPLFAPDIGLSYWDYQARVAFRASDRDQVSAFVFGSHDLLTQRETVQIGSAPGATRSAVRQLVADEFHRLDLRWDRALGTGAAARMALTLGRDQVGDQLANATSDTARLRGELDWAASRSLRVRAGADVQLAHERPEAPPPNAPISFPSLAALAVSRDAVTFGAHVDAAWRITPRVEVVPGLRADVYATTASTGLPAAVRPVLEPR